MRKSNKLRFTLLFVIFLSFYQSFGQTIITIQPNNQAVCEDSMAIFSISATGTSLSYQWRKDGSNISGAIDSAYSIFAADTLDEGNYDCIVSGTSGNDTSIVASLNVNIATQITHQPSNQIVCEDSMATFSISAIGTSLSYQWRKDGANISGATSSIITISATDTLDVGNYDCIVSGTCGSVTSGVASLILNMAPIISTQLYDKTVCIGSSTTFSITATGTGLTYQWKKNGEIIVGETNQTYTIDSVYELHQGTYQCIVYNECAIVESVISNLIVIPVGVIGSWSFNDGTANDDSDYLNHGTVNGATLTSDRFGNENSAFSFDGIDDYIEIGDKSIFDFGNNDFSISTWLKIDSLPNEWMAIVNKAGSGMTGYGLEISSLNNISGSIQGLTGSNQHCLTSTIETGKWLHIVVNYNRDDAINIYVNNVLVQSCPYNIGNESSVDNSSSLTFGKYSGGIWRINGIIDDIKIFNYTLSETEITELYSAPNPAGLIGSWSFNDGTANDVSGSNNHGTVNGATATNDRFGNENSAYSFDGINDYLQVPYFYFENNEEWSLSFWMNWKESAVEQFWIFLLGQENSSIYDIIIKSGNNRLFGYRVADTSYAYGQINSLESIYRTGWHQLTITASSDSSMSYYIDGEFKESIITDTKFVLNSIGKAYPNETYSFPGELDDIKLYNRELGVQEVNQLYSETIKDSIVTVLIDTDVTLESYINSPAYIYQWQYRANDSLEWNNVIDGTSPQITFSTIQMNDAGSYRCLVKDTDTTKFFFETKYNLTVLLEEGLVGSWSFNDGAANDESGNNNQGTVNGATLANDRFGNEISAYTFDGINDYLQVPDFTFENNEEWSLSLWMNWKEPVVDEYFIFLLGQENNAVFDIIIKAGDNRFGYRGADASYAYGQINSLESMYNTGWHQLTITASSDSSMSYYIDGEFKESIITDTKIILNGIGKAYPSETYSFPGELDDIKLYNRELGEQEVNQLYSETIKDSIVMVFSDADLTLESYITSPEYIYRWQYRANDSLEWNNVIGGISSQITFSSIQMSDAGNYRCLVKDSVTTKFFFETNYNLTILLEEGLVGSWAFNDGTANDESGNNYHGIVNGATITNDRFGNENSAYSFDGLDDYIELSGCENFASPQGTISFWMKAEDNTRGIFWFYSDVTGEYSLQDYIRSYIYSDGRIDLVVEDEDELKINVQYDLNQVENGYLNQWIHITWTQDGSGVKLYINGNEAILTYYTSAGLDWWSNHLDITKAIIGNGWGYFDGNIDDFKIHNYALNANQVKDLYDISNQACFDNPVSQFNVTGGGVYCIGGLGANIGLENSEQNVLYELIRDNTISIDTIIGNGEILDFGVYGQVGTYTVHGINETCKVEMIGSAVIDTTECNYDYDQSIVLDKDIKGSIYNTTDSKLKFIYKSKYNENGDLNYKIFNAQHIEIISGHNLTNPSLKYGYNNFELNLTGLVPGVYMLQVENVKKERWYLKFKVN